MVVAVYPSACSEALAAALTLADVDVAFVGDLDSPEIAEAAVLVVELADEPMRRLRQIERIADDVGLPVIVASEPSALPLIERTRGVTDFVLEPIITVEFGVRLRRHLKVIESDERLLFKDLELNPLTYQAALDGRPLDLTYMEYELLKFLAQHPGKVFTRETLLSRVWGYEYYGGARTVDVHIRRLRAKLGEEHAGLIQTVRSVGYRFGQSRWGL